MAWPEKTAPTTDASEKRTIGEGVFTLCKGCGATIAAEVLVERFGVCPDCEHHHRIDHESWRALICDADPWQEWASDLAPDDPLGFKDDKTYLDRIARSQKKTGLRDAMVIGETALNGRAIAYGAFVFGFMGGSMGSVVGEKITILFEKATEKSLPVVLLQTSGGARMQEGILSLMQMAKAVSALEVLRAKKLPFISCLLDPTTGGVAASFAFLGDVNIAEPGALIGFAGPRVIENTIREKLPEGFQRTEFLIEHGMVDFSCSRLQMKSRIETILSHICTS